MVHHSYRLTPPFISILTYPSTQTQNLNYSKKQAEKILWPTLHPFDNTTPVYNLIHFTPQVETYADLSNLDQGLTNI